MTRPVPFKCATCGADITMAGSEVCRICVPNPLEDDSKHVDRCSKCFEEHMEMHARVVAACEAFERGPTTPEEKAAERAENAHLAQRLRDAADEHVEILRRSKEIGGYKVYR